MSLYRLVLGYRFSRVSWNFIIRWHLRILNEGLRKRMKRMRRRVAGGLDTGILSKLRRIRRIKGRRCRGCSWKGCFWIMCALSGGNLGKILRYGLFLWGLGLSVGNNFGWSCRQNIGIDIWMGILLIFVKVRNIIVCNRRIRGMDPKHLKLTQDVELNCRLKVRLCFCWKVAHGYCLHRKVRLRRIEDNNRHNTLRILRDFGRIITCLVRKCHGS